MSKRKKSNLSVHILTIEERHWDACCKWVFDKIDCETTDDDEMRDIRPGDILDYLREMKYSVNDTERLKGGIPCLYDNLKQDCDKYINEKHQELMKLWIEK